MVNWNDWNDRNTVKKYRKGRIEIADCIYFGNKNDAKMRVGACQILQNKVRVGIEDCIYYGIKILRKNEGLRMSALTKIPMFATEKVRECLKDVRKFC